ncbi:restriction endonuclease subunit S [Streptomyces sp. NPDC090052]|uniref:restriction endonuclease subunit S n=1 Tax=Streptomyces sp. NPDC090052 TaxID=3365931 RepID=UPI0037F486C0
MSSEGGQWPLEPLGSLCRVNSGMTPSRTAGARYFTHQGIPWVKTLDLNEGSLEATDESLTEVAVAETGARIYPAQSVLLAMYGGWQQIGRTSILAVPAAVNQAISVLETGAQLDPRYLLLALQHSRPQWSRHAASTRKDPNITKSDVLEFGVRVPPMRVQQRIVEVIDSVSELERGIEASIAKLRVMRSAVTDAMLAGIEWDCPLPDALAGPIRNGFSPVESVAWTGVQMLGLGCLTPSGFAPAQLKNAPPSVTAAHGAILEDGDLLMSRANTRELVGLVGVYRDVGTPCIYPDLMMRMRPSGRCSAPFLAAVLTSSRARRRIRSMSQGTSESMVKISAGAVREIRVPLPSLPVQEHVLAAIDSVTEQLNVEVGELAKFRNLKQGLVDQLLSGRVAASSAMA